MDQDKPKPARARGPITYDLKGQSYGDFELMCFRLIRLDYPKVEKPHDVSDGGADALLAEPGGYARAWQAKHFPGSINWTECRKSFESALANYEPKQYTFCFPRNLTKAELRTFDKHFRQADNHVLVDYWNGDELQARLSDTDRGRAVAAHFFDDDGEKLDAIKRAALAKGTLDTPHDALERMQPVGEFLAQSDPYFSYSAATYREASPAQTPIAKGAIMSVERSEGGIVSRLDVVPNDAEALDLFAPRGTMTFDAGVYRKLAEGLARGEAVTADDVVVNWEQLPPALSEDIGQPMRAQVTIGPAVKPQPPAPWRARVKVQTGADSAGVDLDLKPVDPPAGWEGCLEGAFAGLTLRILVRRTETGGESTLKYHYSLDSSPARDQLQVLRLLDLAAREGGTMSILDRDGGDRQVSLATGAPEDRDPLYALTAFLESIVEIEDWAGVRLPVGPEKFTNEYFQGAATVAAALRRGGFHILFHQIEVSVTPEEFAGMGQGGPVLIEREISATVLDQEIAIGTTRIELPDSDCEQLVLQPDGRQLVRLTPKGETPAKLLERIVNPKSQRPPPPPPRKGSKSRRRGRRRRRGGRS